MNLSVESITQNDLSTLLIEHAYKVGWYYSQEDVHFYFNYPCNKIYSIKVEGELAGCVIFHESPSYVGDKPVRSIGSFLITEKYRGQKTVGPYLLQRAMLDHIHPDTLVCFHSVPRVADFYNRLGFKHVGLANHFYTLMVKEIDPTYRLQLPPSNEIKRMNIDDHHKIKTYNKNLFHGSLGIGFNQFIEAWLKRPDSIVFSYIIEGNVRGYGAATVCREEENQPCYRLSPIYADNPSTAGHLLRVLVDEAVKLNAYRIELSSIATLDTEFGSTLKKIGFIERGKNLIVCSHPELMNTQSPILKKIFCALPLEYPPEAIAALEVQEKSRREIYV